MITAPSGARLPRSTAVPVPGGLERVGQRLDHLAVPALRAGHVVPDAGAGDGDRAGVQQAGLGQLAHHGGQAAGVAEVLHQVLPAGLQVDQGRHVAGQRVEVLEGQRHAQPPGDGQQVDHGVGGAADGRVHPDRVLERLPGHDGRGPQVLLDQVHDDLPGPLRASRTGGSPPPARSPSRAAACRAPRPSRPWWTRCPWSCSARRTGTCSPRRSSTPPGSSAPRPGLPPTARRPCPSRRRRPGTCR